MVNIYKFEQYRSALTSLFVEMRKNKKGWSTALLSEKIGVQPSHITNVIKGRNHFSSDQLCAIGIELNLTQEEINFLDLLKEWERSEHPVRKSTLLKQIQQTRAQKLRLEKELKIAPPSFLKEEMESYYLDPNFELIHLYLGTKKAPTDSHTIAKIWNFPEEYVEQIITFLRSKGLIEKQKTTWLTKPIHQLLPTSSSLCKPQQMLKRLRVLDVLQKNPTIDAYTFSATLTMTEDSKLYIQGLFLEFIKEIEKEVLKSQPENIYHLQFDLVPWIDKKMKAY